MVKYFRGIPKNYFLAIISKYWWFQTKLFTRLLEFIKIYIGFKFWCTSTYHPPCLSSVISFSAVLFHSMIADPGRERITKEIIYKLLIRTPFLKCMHYTNLMISGNMKKWLNQRKGRSRSRLGLGEAGLVSVSDSDLEVSDTTQNQLTLVHILNWCCPQ